MSPTPIIREDQRATLSLLLRLHKSYAEVAQLLAIDEQAVRIRAQGALLMLAPREAAALPAERREELGDRLLNQHGSALERVATRRQLAESAAARAWTEAVRDGLFRLLDLAPSEMPPGYLEGLPEARAANRDFVAESSPERPTRPTRIESGVRKLLSRDSSTRKAAMLLPVVAAIAVVVVLVVIGGRTSPHASGARARTVQTTGSAATGSTQSATTQTAKVKEDERITLRSPDSSSRASGIAEVLSEGKQRAFYLAAQNLPPSKGRGFFYAVWLYNSATNNEPLSRAPDVGSSGRMQGGATLPSDAGNYHTMLVTRETSTKPATPGRVVLKGDFSLG